RATDRTDGSARNHSTTGSPTDLAARSCERHLAPTVGSTGSRSRHRGCGAPAILRRASDGAQTKRDRPGRYAGRGDGAAEPAATPASHPSRMAPAVGRVPDGVVVGYRSRTEAGIVRVEFRGGLVLSSRPVAVGPL